MLTDHNMPTATTRPDKEQCFHLYQWWTRQQRKTTDLCKFFLKCFVTYIQSITFVCVFIFKRPTSLSLLLFLCLHNKVRLPLSRKLCYTYINNDLYKYIQKSQCSQSDISPPPKKRGHFRDWATYILIKYYGIWNNQGGL